MHPASQHEGGRGVAKVVEAEVTQAGALHERPEGPPKQVAGLDRGPDLRAEDEALVTPAVAGGQALLDLTSAVTRQGVDRLAGQLDRAAR